MEKENNFAAVERPVEGRRMKVVRFTDWVPIWSRLYVDWGSGNLFPGDVEIFWKLPIQPKLRRLEDDFTNQQPTRHFRTAALANFVGSNELLLRTLFHPPI